ncbi:MAG TPA: 2-oxo-4-hydroxy-4-carboxy-5-ureidoimidazoline decarboxylase [Xanthomonadales bacterium]|nr:2-oxo-4-hydroxy-4-carboxy-5-ureidoimidazoline decarboxylase [Xanthomonadales bacterium]
MNHDEQLDGDRDQFLKQFGSVVEHSPWVAEAVWNEHNRAARSYDFESLVDAFGRVIRSAPEETQLELLSAHPDLACGVVASSALSRESKEEQEGAGLDRCSPQEFIEFQTLNIEYRKDFGFPFIIAVRGMNRREILKSFHRRIERSKEKEFATAIENVIRIIGYRIANILSGKEQVE